jgi:hypothetical protein
MTKLAAILEIFDLENLFDKWPSKSIDINKFIRAISIEGSYSLQRELHTSAATISKLLTKILPDRQKTSKPVCYFLLEKYGLKYCPKCKLVHSRDSFHKNSSKLDGLGVYCITCFNDDVRDMRRVYQASRRASKINRTPSWANFLEIKEFYKNCPVGYHVDHIIPLNGELVSGLHVTNNLQYLSARDNIVKSNKYSPA